MCGGDIKELHSSLYSRMDGKATKYRDLVDGKLYVIALYHGACHNFIETACHLAFSAWVPYVTFSNDGTVVERGHRDQWSTPEKSSALFELHPHLSGMIYSRWMREHYFLPNPWANTPVSADLFPFACIPPNRYIINGDPAWEERDPLISDDYALPPNTHPAQIERLR